MARLPAASPPDPDPSPRCLVVALLSEYLCVSEQVGWPGTDGLTLEEVVRSIYPLAVAARRVPGPDVLIKEHSELAEAISAFFLPVGGS